MTCGLIGRRLRHSYSPQIHRALADYDYKLWELEPEELETFFRRQDADHAERVFQQPGLSKCRFEGKEIGRASCRERV